MSISAALDEIATQRKAKTCSVGTYFADQSPEDITRITAFLDNGGSRNELHKALTIAGFALRSSTLNNHLAGRCGCPRNGRLVAV